MLPTFIDPSKVPHRSGVYIFRNTENKTIYVGKAIDLYHRVSSYFSGKLDSPKTVSLVENIAGCETIVVESEIEALILEANLIKKYRPVFNIRLMDDKDYLYIKVTAESFPKIITARKTELRDSLEYFGPFPSSRVVKETLKKLRRLFPWCANPPKETQSLKLKVRHRPCFYYHLGLCPGACVGKISVRDYKKIINRFIKFMEGKKVDLVKSLEAEMDASSKVLEFEKANYIKRIITGVDYLTQINKAESYLENPNFLELQNKKSLEELKLVLNLAEIPERIECFDVSNIGGKNAVGSLVVLTDGDIDKKWYRRFKVQETGKPNDFAMMAEIVRRRLNHPEWPKPNLILIDGGKGQVGAALKEIRSRDKDVPVFGLAKKMEWLYREDFSVIKLPRTSLALRLLQKTRDEAHRFAISYHRKVRMREAVYNR
ncbi:MAG: excinuclease ABC subunit UvrC [Candidatus Daviesbacteria bacterium]|nr:excinuclease ABC subunit UvrC [Candidatus Daviesbacteria bacterium]